MTAQRKTRLFYAARVLAPRLVKLALLMFFGAGSYLAFGHLGQKAWLAPAAIFVAAVGLHTFLHQKSALPSRPKRACRAAFFFSMMLFWVLAGHQVGHWLDGGGTDLSIVEASIGGQSLASVEPRTAVPPARFFDEKSRSEKWWERPGQSVKRFFQKEYRANKPMTKAQKTWLWIGIALGIIALVVLAAVKGDKSDSSDYVNCGCGGDDDNVGCSSDTGSDDEVSCGCG